MSDAPLPFRYFEPKEEYFVVERRDLPHWAQAGTICFITWRTWDSMPQPVLEAWANDRDAWLKQHGADPHRHGWKAALAQLPFDDRIQFHEEFSQRWEELLDNGYGSCVLRRPELAKIVGDSLRHFDGERYVLFDFVIMPNHVHLLAAFSTAEEQLKQCNSWKHFTAVRINRALTRKGRFWEVDDFDHLVRSEEQFCFLRDYIAMNPRRGGLREGEFLHYSRAL
jgi:putative transposase